MVALELGGSKTGMRGEKESDGRREKLTVPLLNLDARIFTNSQEKNISGRKGQ